MGELDELAQVVQKKREPYSAAVASLTQSLSQPVAQSRPASRTYARAAGYRQRCGKRSFICQVIFAAWTVPVLALYLNALAGAWRGDLATQNLAANSYPGSALWSMAMDRRGSGMYWATIFWGVIWAPVAVPFGVAAIVTMKE